jgi:hypothetical protein
MASGIDARLGVAKETTFGTRVAPTRFFPFNSEDFGYEYNRYSSPALGVGRWTRPSIVTTSVGSGALAGDVPTTGFGYLLDGLHGNAVSPVQQGATTAYLQTHTLDTPPSKSFTIQVGTPPVTSSVLVPHELQGVMFGGITFSWEPASVLRFSIPTVIQKLDITQTLATYTPPAAWDVLSFRGGDLKIAGTTVPDIIGGGSMTVGASLRDDAFALGSSGLIAKPVETDKPTASGTFTADFNDNTHLSRTINDTMADVVLRFTGSIIASTFAYWLEVTIPDCKFTTSRPTVGGPGPVDQTVNFTNASSTNDPVVITYQTTGATL